MTDPIDDLVRKGEAAYAAMYDARPYDLKDLRDDALGWFRQALALAKQAGRADLVQDLEARIEKVDGVFRQLRG